MPGNPPPLEAASKSFLEEYPATPAFAARLRNLEGRGPTGALPPGENTEPDPEELRAAAAFLIHYIALALDDHSLSEAEQARIRWLKRYFGLEEGDLLRLQRESVTELLLAEMGLILRDAQVDAAESLHQVHLQQALDLGYDQFLDLIEPRVRPMVEKLLDELRGKEYIPRKLRDDVTRRLQLLNTVIPLDPATLEVQWSSTAGDVDPSGDPATRTIPQAVRDAVWRRDAGRCTVCRSQDRLEFDHVIPFSKGGASTYRNVQLLCQDCNRRKSVQVG